MTVFRDWPWLVGAGSRRTGPRPDLPADVSGAGRGSQAEPVRVERSEPRSGPLDGRGPWSYPTWPRRAAASSN
jgi:hypothetical protein